MKSKFKEVPLEERLRLLRDNAEKSEMMTYQKDLSDEDVQAHRSEYVQKDIEFQKKEDDFKQISTDFNEEKKAYKKTRVQMMGEIKTASKSVTEEVFLLANHEDKQMEYYNTAGDMVHSRRLTQEERQMAEPGLRKVAS